MAFVISLLLALPQDPPLPTEFLERVEKSLEEASSITLSFKGECRDSGDRIPYSGTLRAKRGGMLFLTFSSGEGERRTEIRVQSDGSKIVVESNRRSTMDCPQGLTRFVLRGIARMGMFEFAYILGRFGEGSGKELSRDLGEMAVSLELTSSRAEERDQIILESVFAYANGKKPLKRGRTKLWVDEKTLLPIRRTAEYKKDDPMFVFTEMYEKISMDEIPDSEFRLD